MKISVENKRKKNIDMNFAPLPKDLLCGVGKEVESEGKVNA